ncbi:3-oxoacyl-[acyl-carrier-protein] reductase FabG [Aquisphaera giovannonii]|uniref:3-oxoacyl-[acyl-carrier-protein] reductase FabG n=1 Tax=Aquisphaera giovannonii TaxID=406548 RepID=A0A5B9WCP6_9BACT|nr:SDR family oxidoreductase [Aquisphaera giovannonii]QEH38009.1 3-oxoacyl-[acyl-carrier-protein] reductase FabG [Aquisphaera giovannonii]
MAESSGKPVAVVTGGAQGIGAGIAAALGEAGYAVVVADVLQELAGETACQLAGRSVEVAGVRLDVTSADEWARVMREVDARWGGLDVLVNNAGISPRGTIESTDEALWDQTMAINLKGAWLGIKAALPLLRKRKGTIINIGSTRATRPMPGLFPYVISKAGLYGLTRQVANECLAEGITCNMVAPGWVDTPNERKIQARHGRPDFPAGIRNLTTPEDVGAAVVFLASRHGRKVHGDILYVDSGLHVADDAGMVHLPDRVRPPFEQRIEEA